MYNNGKWVFAEGVEMEKKKELRLAIMQFIYKNSQASRQELKTKFVSKKFTDVEVNKCFDFLYLSNYVFIAGTKENIPQYQISGIGEDYLDNLKKEKEVIKKHWYGTIMLIASIVTLVFVLLDYFVK